MITNINEFKKYIRENIENDSTYEILKGVLNNLTDLKDLDILVSLVESGTIFTSLHVGPGNLNNTYTKFHRELIPNWIKSLGMDRLTSGGDSINKIYNNAEQFSRWIEEKGYDSQECFLAYIPGEIYRDSGSPEEDNENFSTVDDNDVQNSINILSSEIKNKDLNNHERGYFRMGFDVMANENEQPGWALFLFQENSYSDIKETKLDSYIYYEKESINVIFQPNTVSFYNFNPGGPYGSTGLNKMVDFCSEEGYVLRQD